MKKSAQWAVAGLGMLGVFAWIQSGGMFKKNSNSKSINFSFFIFDDDLASLGGVAGIQNDLAKFSLDRNITMELTGNRPLVMGGAKGGPGKELSGRIYNPKGLNASFLTGVKAAFERNAAKDIIFSGLA